MPVYTAPQRDMRFLLHDVLHIDRYNNLPGFDQAAPDLVDAILNEAGRFAEEVLAPLNQIGDTQGCRFADGSVTTPDGFRQAYEQLVAGGWCGLTADPDYGGQGLPAVLGCAFNEFVSSANMAFGMYPGLSHGAYSALHQYGTPEQKALYLPHLVSGRWTGTMNLTEPQCGTDLGLMRTRAAPRDDGSYAITGTKIFISAGEHDLAENIVHLVLARIDAPGTPPGIKGVSLFVAPKFLPAPDGAPGERNALSCGSIEDKMGIHGNATCVMNYDGATGWLVGQPHKGMRAMFTMMNEARMGVALQGLAQSEAAYQSAAAYARERLQGRALTGPQAPGQPADPIIVHPDVRRILMDIKAFNEGARALLLWTALHGDIAVRSADEEQRVSRRDLLDLMTPVLKGVFTDCGFANTVAAQQVFGGHGYITEWGMSQFVRDSRIAMIYEGTNGIQALDLVGRKLGAGGGRAIAAFCAEIDALLDSQGEHDGAGLEDFIEPLRRARACLEDATAWIQEHGLADFNNAGAGATDYMHLLGLTALAFMWTQMAAVSAARLREGPGQMRDFHEAKLVTGRYFMARNLPETALRLARIRAGAAGVMALDAEAF